MSNKRNPTIKNLKPFNKMTAEEKRRISSMGGKARQEQVKERKARQSFKELLLEALHTPVLEEKVRKQIKKRFPNLSDDYKGLFTSKLLKMGSTKLKPLERIKLTEFIRDTIGEKPVDEVVQTNANIEIKDKKVIDSVIDKLKGF